MTLKLYDPQFYFKKFNMHTKMHQLLYTILSEKRIN